MSSVHPHAGTPVRPAQVLADSHHPRPAAGDSPVPNTARAAMAGDAPTGSTAPVDEVLMIPCQGEPMLGLLSRAPQPADTAVLVIVGGPQYRVGAHRQYVLLARSLAALGWPTLRCDVRGMGDSGGVARDFNHLHDDITAAIDGLCQALPEVRRVVLWGLCDGASAALMYWQASGDARVAGLCLANPWLRSDASEARTRVKHYYLQRLTQPDFWRKLLRGGIGLGAVTGLAQQVGAATQRGDAAPGNGLDFRQRMAQAWRRFPGPVLLMLSGRDFTAKEFLDGVQRDEAWRGALQRSGLTRLDRPQADHTFSAPADHQALTEAVARWLQASFGQDTPSPATATTTGAQP
jgi:exosortase A-associated hydrolase 1